MLKRHGFSMIEVVVALIIVSCGFIPILNLFRQNNATTVNNIQETQATNYASDLINFCKDVKYFQLEGKINGDSETFENDEKIKNFFDQLNLNMPVAVKEPFSRSMVVKKFESTTFREDILNFLNKLIHKDEQYSIVPSFLITVKVTFPRLSGAGQDEVILYTLVMD